MINGHNEARCGKGLEEIWAQTIGHLNGRLVDLVKEWPTGTSSLNTYKMQANSTMKVLKVPLDQQQSGYAILLFLDHCLSEICLLPRSGGYGNLWHQQRTRVLKRQYWHPMVIYDRGHKKYEHTSGMQGLT